MKYFFRFWFTFMTVIHFRVCLHSNKYLKMFCRIYMLVSNLLGRDTLYTKGYRNLIYILIYKN